VNGWQEPSGNNETPQDVSVYPPEPRLTEYRPLRQTANLARASLAVIALASVVAAVFDVAERSLLDRVGSGESVTRGEASASDHRQLAISVVVLLLWIVTTVFFITWLHRAYTNLAALGVAGLRFGTGWAIGAWFVPFLNLVRPVQIVNDVWRGSHPYLHDRLGWRDRPVPRVFAFWWAAWLIAGFVGGVAGRLLLSAEDSGEFEAWSAVYIASDVLTAVAAILALVVVDRTTARQAASAARAAGGEQPAPPTQWLRGGRRLAAAAGLGAVAAGLGALVVAVQPPGTTSSSDGGPPAADGGSPSASPSLSDDFSDPASGWIEQDDEEVLYGYEDGEYRMTARNTEATWFSFLGIEGFVNPLRIEADARLASPASADAAAGIGCFVSERAGYVATVWLDGSWAIGADPVDSEELALLSNGAFPDPLPAATRLELVCEGGPPAKVELTVNGRRAGSGTDDTGVGRFSLVALIVLPGPAETTAYFDNVEATSP